MNEFGEVHVGMQGEVVRSGFTTDKITRDSYHFEKGDKFEVIKIDEVTPFMQPTFGKLPLVTVNVTSSERNRVVKVTVPYDMTRGFILKNVGEA